MKSNKQKLLTASILVLLGSQSGNVLAEDATTTQSAGQAAAPAATQATATDSQAPAPAQAPQPVHRGYQYPYYNPYYYQPYRKRKGSGFSFSSDDGPDWDSGPGWGRDRGYYDRGRSYSGPWNRGRGSGTGFGFSSDDGPDWDPAPRYRPAPGPGPGYDPRYDRGRGYYDRGRGFRGPWNDDNGSGMNFSW